ncbi:DUF3558 family protein [Corynebacterium breve]|uniref:DUF3558 family protein n=1 Tax=Corynebacterium breve TaxID=3049799 RepID=A0ABY8VEA1_9CORY|nr:DUF3558 family protein [Corynebacterium breve]WIM66953.1 DUF3558 family protein [Corynebacterium breve]
MKRTAIIACLLSTGVLASCTSLIDDQPAPTHTSGQEGADVVDASSGADASTDAFHFASGDLEIGPFDPEETLPVLFDPCKEISADEFAAIGFTTDGVTIPAHGGQVLGCGLESDSVAPFPDSIVVAGLLASSKEVERQARMQEGMSSTVLKNAVVVENRPFDGTACGSYVETHRGTLWVEVSNGRSGTDLFSLCNQSLEILENLYKI